MGVDYREQYKPEHLEPFFPHEIVKMIIVVLCTLALLMFLSLCRRTWKILGSTESPTKSIPPILQRRRLTSGRSGISWRCTSISS